MCVCVCVRPSVCVSVLLWWPRATVGACFLILPCGVWWWSSGHQAWWSGLCASQHFASLPDKFLTVVEPMLASEENSSLCDVLASWGVSRLGCHFHCWTSCGHAVTCSHGGEVGSAYLGLCCLNVPRTDSRWVSSVTASHKLGVDPAGGARASTAEELHTVSALPFPFRDNAGLCALLTAGCLQRSWASFAFVSFMLIQMAVLPFFIKQIIWCFYIFFSCIFKVKLSSLNLDNHAKKKLIKLVGERYCKTTDVLTITTDRWVEPRRLAFFSVCMCTRALAPLCVQLCVRVHHLIMLLFLSMIVSVIYLVYGLRWQLCKVKRLKEAVWGFYFIL